MPEFDAVEAKVVRAAIDRFREAIDAELGTPIRAELRDYLSVQFAERATRTS